MEQRTQTSAIPDIRVSGVPSDASALQALRKVFNRQDYQKRPASNDKAGESAHTIASVRTNGPEVYQTLPGMVI